MAAADVGRARQALRRTPPPAVFASLPTKYHPLVFAEPKTCAHLWANELLYRMSETAVDQRSADAAFAHLDRTLALPLGYYEALVQADLLQRAPGEAPAYRVVELSAGQGACETLERGFATEMWEAASRWRDEGRAVSVVHYQGWPADADGEKDCWAHAFVSADEPQAFFPAPGSTPSLANLEAMVPPAYHGLIFRDPVSALQVWWNRRLFDHVVRMRGLAGWRERLAATAKLDAYLRDPQLRDVPYVRRPDGVLAGNRRDLERQAAALGVQSVPIFRPVVADVTGCERAGRWAFLGEAWNEAAAARERGESAWVVNEHGDMVDRLGSWRHLFKLWELDASGRHRFLACGGRNEMVAQAQAAGVAAWRLMDPAGQFSHSHDAPRASSATRFTQRSPL